MKDSSYILQTPRLGLRTWKEVDLLPFAEMNADPEVMRYFPAVRTFEETKQSLQEYKAHFKRYGYGFYAVDQLVSGRFIGFVGLNHPWFEADFMPCVEIGWRLRKEFWNKGYATEAAKRCVYYAFNELKLEELVAFTSRLNKPSERVMRKIGMNKIKYFLHPAVSKGHALEEHILYSIRPRMSD